MFNWLLLPEIPRVTFLSIRDRPTDVPERFEWIVVDGCDVDLPDNSFDIVFSNSVIEHVGTPERQRQMAEEIRRLAPRYWVQNPNYWFPMEPHLWTPFIHWFPRRWQRPLYPLTGWGLIYRPSRERMDTLHETVRLLKGSEFRPLFPDERILVERVLDLAKSFVAYR